MSERQTLFIIELVSSNEEHLETIHYREGDTPEAVAFLFCKERELGIDVFQFVLETLRGRVEAFEKEKKVTKTGRPEDREETNSIYKDLIEGRVRDLGGAICKQEENLFE